MKPHKNRLEISPDPGCNKPCKIKTCNTSQTLLRRSRTSHHCTPTLYHCSPHTCTIVPPTSCHCTIYIAPLHSLHRTIVPLHCTIGLPTPYHCTLYIVPLHPYMVPLCPLYRTIVPLRRTIVYTPASYHHLSYHCTPYIVPVHPLYRTIAPSHRTIAPATSYHCTAYIAPLYLHHRTTALSSLHHRTCTSDPVPASRTPWQSSHLPRDYLSEQFFWKLITLSLSPKEVWKSNFRVTDLWKPLNPTEKSFTAKRFHSKEASQQRDLTAKRSHSKEISQQRGPAAKKSHSKEIA